MGILHVAKSGFFRVTVKGGGRQSLEVGAVAWWGELGQEGSRMGLPGWAGGGVLLLSPHMRL